MIGLEIMPFRFQGTVRYKMGMEKLDSSHRHPGTERVDSLIACRAKGNITFQSVNHICERISQNGNEANC